MLHCPGSSKKGELLRTTFDNLTHKHAEGTRSKLLAFDHFLHISTLVVSRLGVKPSDVESIN